MANQIKLKNGSGSDPSASDLVVGEVALRTDSGQLFTKKDDGTIGEIGAAAGVSDGDKGDITVSNSGATFTIDDDAITTTKIADVQVTTSKLVLNAVVTNRITDGAVTSAKIADGTIVNADINASAAIARTKLANVDLVDDTSPQLGNTLDMNGHSISGGDSAGATSNRIKMGTHDDLLIYHDGSNSYISDVGTGSLYIQGENLVLENTSGDNYFAGVSGGKAILYHNGNNKFETSTTGITVNGGALVGGNIEINQDAYLKIGASNDLSLTHTGTDSYIQNVTGDLYLTNTGTNSDDIFIKSADNIFFHVHGTETGLNILGDGAVELYHGMGASAASEKKFETTSTGVTVTGLITTNDITIGDNSPVLNFTDNNADADNKIWHFKCGGSNDFLIQAINDSGGGGGNFFKMTRSGNSIQTFEGLRSGTTWFTVDNINRKVTTRDLDVTNNITVTGTVDGVDIAARDSVFGALTSGNATLNNGVQATTQSAGDSSTKVATTAFVSTAISNLIDSSPGTLNTLNELAAALGDDASFSTTVTNSIATKLPLAGGTLTGALAIEAGAHTQLTVKGTEADIHLTSTGSGSNKTWRILGSTGTNTHRFRIYDAHNSREPFYILDSGTVNIDGNLDVGAGVDVTGNITVTGTVDGRDVAADGSKLDTYEANGSSYVRSDASDTLTGATYTISSSTNEKLQLAGSSNPFIRFQEGTTNKAYIQWSSAGYFQFANTESGEILRIKDGNNGLIYDVGGTENKVFHAGNDGSGSGLDSDLLDGVQGSSYLRSDAADTFSHTLTNASKNEAPSVTAGCLNLQPSASGGKTGIIFRSKINHTSDFGYLWWYDDNDNYANNSGNAENGVLVVGAQNDDASGTPKDAVAIESAGNIWLNAGIGTGIGGANAPDRSKGKVLVGKEGSSAEVTAFPSGTRMIFQQTSAPTGWTKDTSDTNQRALRVVSGTAGSGGSMDFTTAFASHNPSGVTDNTTQGGTVANGGNNSNSTTITNISIASATQGGSIGNGGNNTNSGGNNTNSTTVGGSVNNHTLSTSQMPSHKHTVKTTNSDSNSSGSQGYPANDNHSCPRTTDRSRNRNINTNTMDNTGSTSSHSHGFSGSSHSHSINSHTHSINAHSHSFSGNSHSHTYSGSSHSHSIDAHNHGFTGSAHNHTFTGTAISLAVKYLDVIIAQKD